MQRDFGESLVLSSVRIDINYFHGTKGSHKVEKGLL